MAASSQLYPLPFWPSSTSTSLPFRSTLDSSGACHKGSVLLGPAATTIAAVTAVPAKCTPFAFRSNGLHRHDSTKFSDVATEFHVVDQGVVAGAGSLRSRQCPMAAATVSNSRLSSSSSTGCHCSSSSSTLSGVIVRVRGKTYCTGHRRPIADAPCGNEKMYFEGYGNKQKNFFTSGRRCHFRRDRFNARNKKGIGRLTFRFAEGRIERTIGNEGDHAKIKTKLRNKHKRVRFSSSIFAIDDKETVEDATKELKKRFEIDRPCTFPSKSVDAARKVSTVLSRRLRPCETHRIPPHSHSSLPMSANGHHHGHDHDYNNNNDENDLSELMNFAHHSPQRDAELYKRGISPLPKEQNLTASTCPPIGYVGIWNAAASPTPAERDVIPGASNDLSCHRSYSTNSGGEKPERHNRGRKRLAIRGSASRPLPLLPLLPRPSICLESIPDNGGATPVVLDKPEGGGSAAVSISTAKMSTEVFIKTTRTPVQNNDALSADINAAVELLERTRQFLRLLGGDVAATGRSTVKQSNGGCDRSVHSAAPDDCHPRLITPVADLLPFNRQQENQKQQHKKCRIGVCDRVVTAWRHKEGYFERSDYGDKYKGDSKEFIGGEGALLPFLPTAVATKPQRTVLIPMRSSCQSHPCWMERCYKGNNCPSKKSEDAPG